MYMLLVVLVISNQKHHLNHSGKSHANTIVSHRLFSGCRMKFLK